MFGIFIHDAAEQKLVWLANVDTIEAANERVAEHELESDDAIMVIALAAFKM